MADAAGEGPLFAVRFLSTREDLVLVRMGFAEELDLLVWALGLKVMQKSCVIRPADRIRIDFGRRLGPTTVTEQLVVLPYDRFLERVRRHADFAKDSN